MRGAARVGTVILTLVMVASLTSEAVAQFGRSKRAAPAERPPSAGTIDDGPDAVGTYGLSTPQVLQLIDAGEARPALAAYEQAAKDAEAAGNLGTAIRAGHAAVIITTRLNMLQRTLTLGTRVMELGKGAPLSLQATRAFLSTSSIVARAYRDVGDLAQARRILEQTLAHARAALPEQRRKHAAMMTALLTRLSEVEAAEGDTLAAVGHAREAVHIAESTLGGRPNEREKEMLRRQLARTYVDLGRYARKAGRLDEAADALSKASGYAKVVGLTELVGAVAKASSEVALDRGDAVTALRLASAGRADAERVGLANRLHDFDVVIAKAHARLGDANAALGAAARALAAAESTRGELRDPGQRAGFLEERQGLYSFAVDQALRLDRPEEAFAFAERGRSRAFLDLLGNAVLSKGRTRALAREESALRARLAEAALPPDEEAETDGTEGRERRRRERVAAAERDYRAFLQRVRAESGEQAALMAVEPVTAAEIQALLPDDTTLLEFLVSGQEVVLWIVDRHGVEVRRMPGDRGRLVAEVRDFRAAIASQAPLADVHARALSLYRTLLGPAREKIRGRRLLVVPHDVLHYLPFAALRSPDDRWLVEEHAVGTVPSASVLKFLVDKGTTASDAVLAVGNPDLGPALALRYAEREVRAIGERFGAKGTVLIRTDAAESRVKRLASQAGLLHFAVHGELNEADPMASALLLVPGDGEDGRLEVRELFVTELNARLVVLSACETGLGKLSRGDELVGLQRAFLYAGTPAVVTTLWKVDDRASYLLMRGFYDALAAKGPTEALRSAQRALMVDHPHPFAWAAFGLTGRPR